MSRPAAPRNDVVAEFQRRRLNLTVGLLKIYGYYRVLLGVALLIVSEQNWLATQLGTLAPDWFRMLAVGYALFNLLAVLLLQTAPPRYFQRQVIAIGLSAVDVMWLAAMMYCSGGVASGIDPLMLVTVAAGAVVIRGPWSTFIAALATITVLALEVLVSLEPGEVPRFFEAGMLGVLFFVFSLLIQNLSRRLRSNEMQALRQAAELADLERINKQIVQRMRTGIVVVDRDNRVRTFNESARALLGQMGSTHFNSLPDPLAEELTDWRNNTSLRTPPFQLDPRSPQIRVNFSAVRSDDPHGDVTIFVEDTGEIYQQAQQLKLAELGRLSASIAHEIRNPLGAISHAAQLLRESQNLDRGDERLTEIIHSHSLRMNDVVENVLEVSRRSPPNPKRILLLELVQDFVKQSRDSLSGANITTHVDPDSTEIRVDPSQLTQVLTNLVTNAVRHGGEGSERVHVQLIGGIDTQSGRPFLNVIDDGPGVPPEEVASVFDPFHTTKVNGTGLGLYISRELCETNQAQLNYIADYADGACFRILFTHPNRISL